MLVALVRACHPLPTAVVVLVTTALAWRTGWSMPSVLLLSLAVLLGQLSIGWSNDAHDAVDDVHAHRAAKPVVAGRVTPQVLMLLAWLALGACAVASWVVAGWAAGTVHVIAVLMGWLYNFVLARTRASWVPYAVAFGLLPAFVELGVGATVTWWLVAVFAIVGVSAHLANALRDAASDSAIDVPNIAVVLGSTRTRWIALTLLGVGYVIAVAAMNSWTATAVLALTFAGTSIGLLARRGEQHAFGTVLAGAGALAIVVLVMGVG